MGRHGLAPLLLTWLALACGEPAPPEEAGTVEGLSFGLCGANVASVDVVPGEAGHSVYVALEPDATLEFAELTGAHVGESLAITYGGLLVWEGTIQARITSGVIATPATPETEARGLADVLEALPEAPCGPGGSGS
jgi:preprotein translocase subunit SecD